MTISQTTADQSISDAAAFRLADEVAARMDRLPVTALHRRTAATIALGTFFDSFDSLIIAAALTAIVSSLHISYTQVGLLISSAYVGMTVGAPLFGWLAEVVGRKPVCVWMIAGFGALSLAAAFAWDFQSLLIIRMIEGLALGGQIPVSSALYSEFLPAARRGRGFFWGYTVLFSTGILLAPVVGLICFAVFGPEVGWRALFLSGGLALPLALLMHYIVPESPRWLAENGRGAEADATVARYEQAAREAGKPLPSPQVHYRGERQTTRLTELFHGVYPRRTILSWTLFFATYFVSYGLQIWIPTLYVKIGGLPPSNALMLAIISGAITLCLVFLWGDLADRIGRKNSFIVGYSLSVGGLALGIFLVAGLHITGWPMLFSSGLIALIGTNFTAALCFLYTAELFPTRMRAWATSTGSTISRIGSFIAPTAVGALLDADLGIVSVYLMFAAAGCLGLAAIIFLGPETSKGALEDVSA
ncbi:MAG TPA: MFS transporter [Stellaceae bacterium]|jgi:putative MFS transporter|nr:MFS transporter [Stellaceae bacterium]